MLKIINCLNICLKAGIHSSIMTLLVASPSLIPIQAASASEWQDKVIQERVVWFNPKTQQEQINYVRVPDWTKISFADFPATLRGGSIGDEYNQYVDYDLSRAWNQGDKPASFLKLGDLAEALAPQEFKIQDIVELTGIDLNKIPLSVFPLIGKQTLKQLVDAIPGLGKVKVEDIEPISALISKKALDNYYFQNQPLEQIINNYEIGNLQLEQIDLFQFSISSIPDLENSKLKDFDGWRDSFIEEIPGLDLVPLGSMPEPVTNGEGFVARIDAIWSQAEADRQRTVSGSDRGGFSVPCQTNCAHIELDDLENSGSDLRDSFEGKQWISGQFQEVRGGHGVLGAVNGGKEPTGRLPFGHVFKVAVWDTDETTDRANTSIFFRFCIKTAFVDLGCTPYFIGPIPFLDYQRDDWILLGAD
jgi:hypothetical protein